jgi:hypothetical protein
LLPFPAAIAAWIVTQQAFLVLILLMAASCLGRNLRPGQMVLATLALIGFRYNVLTMGLGQFTLYVLFYLVLAWWLWHKGYDFWAGCALTQAVLKPQLTFLILPLWVVVAGLQRRWRFVAGFVACMAILVVLPLPFAGIWWDDFLNPSTDFAQSAGTALLPGQIAVTLRVVLSAILWPAVAWVWLRAAGLRMRRWAIDRGPAPAFPNLGYGLALATVVTLVTTPRLRGYDLALATLPLSVFLLSPYGKEWRSRAIQVVA